MAQSLAALSGEDLEALHKIYDLRFLATVQLSALAYPKRSLSYTQQRLWRLCQQHLIANVKVRCGRSTLAYWRLDAAGLRAVEFLRGIQTPARVRDIAQRAVLTKHYAAAASVYLGLYQSGCSFTWESSRVGHEYETAWEGHRQITRRVYPDATIHLKLPGGRRAMVFLEIDRSTMDHTDMRVKFEHYKKLFRRLAEEADFRERSTWLGDRDIGYYLLVLTPSTHRAANLQQMLDSLPALAQRMAGTPEALAGQVLDVPSWWGARVAERRRQAAEREAQRRYDEALKGHEQALALWESNRYAWVQRQYGTQGLFKRRTPEQLRQQYEQERPRPKAPAPPADKQ